MTTGITAATARRASAAPGNTRSSVLGEAEVHGALGLDERGDAGVVVGQPVVESIARKAPRSSKPM